MKRKNKLKKLLKSIRKKGYKEAQIVEMVFGNKVIEEPAKVEDTSIDKNIIKVDSEEDRAFYRVEILVSPKELKSNDFLELIPDIKDVFLVEQDGLYKYSVGKFDTFEEAKTYKAELTNTYNLPDAFVTQYKTAW